MNVDLQGRRLLIPAALADHARRRLHDALTHRGDVIQRIVVRLGGTDGHCGRNDMYCLVQVHLSDALVATVVDIGPRLHQLIDRSTDRVGRLVAAHLDQAPRDRRSTASSAATCCRSASGRKSCCRHGSWSRPTTPCSACG